MEGVSALEEIADKYTRKAKYSEDQLGKFSGKEGLIDFFKKLTADVGHPYQHGEDRHQLYHTLREAITLSGGKEHLNDKQVDALIKRFIDDKDLAVFDAIISGLQSMETNAKISGMVNYHLDHLSNDKKLELAATHAAHMHRSSLGVRRPNYTPIAANLSQYIGTSISQTYQNYAAAKESGDTHAAHLKAKKKAAE